MTGLDSPHADAVVALADELPYDLPWALTGSASFALQGVSLAPEDVDVQTSAAGAYEVTSSAP